MPLLKDELLTLKNNGFDVALTGFNETELDDLLTEDILNDGLIDAVAALKKHPRNL